MENETKIALFVIALILVVALVFFRWMYLQLQERNDWRYHLKKEAEKNKEKTNIG